MVRVIIREIGIPLYTRLYYQFIYGKIGDYSDTESHNIISCEFYCTLFCTSIVETAPAFNNSATHCGHLLVTAK